MKRISFVLLMAALTLAASCGSGSTAGSEDVIPPPDGQEDQADAVIGCQTVAECGFKPEDAPGPCMQPGCEQNVCKWVPKTPGTACDDGNKCTDNDQCVQENCEGTPKECADGNLCTNDECEAATGLCKPVNNTNPCDDGNPCTQGDACLNGACAGGQSICECSNDAECAKYNDANACNGVSKCIQGACQVDPASVIDCAGTPAGPCEEVYCEEASGDCKTKAKGDGESCNDDDKCTTGDACDGGQCKGQALDCNDGDECTDDGCDPATGCTNVAVADNTECNDGSLCTTNDKCVAGKCTGDAVEECEGCSTDADCNNFEDGDLCNGTLACIDGQCEVDPDTIVSCQVPLSSCAEVKCIPATGLCETGNALDGTSCEDQNACTEKDYCSGGVCKGLPMDCNDNSACTADSCNPDTGCVYTPKTGSCGDGDPCTINDHCVDGKCVGDPDPTCECTTNKDCEAKEDGDLCNGILKCKSGKCEVDPKTVVVCDNPGLDPCIVPTCDPLTGACDNQKLADGEACDDLNACTDDDKCYASVCKGQPKFCDDGNICTNDSCDVNLGCVYAYNKVDCDDGSICTLNDHCEQGLCVGDPNPDCACKTDADCIPFDDGNKCNGKLVCKGFKCVIDPKSVVACDKSKDTDCLVTYCVPETGTCTQQAFEDGKPCSDADACTLIDACKAGQCEGSVAPDCEDDNVCTDDSCDPALGCLHVPNVAPCDDGDKCTGGDVCLDGICQPGKNDLCGDTSCFPEWALSCGGTDSWGNNKGDATENVTEYACAPDAYEGPEYTYSFTAPYDAIVTVSLSKETAETDLIVLENMGDGCDPDQCRDWGYSSVTFDAVAGQSFFIVVDGYVGASLPPEGTWTIDLDCQPLHEINCADGIDEDKDFATDCDDDDCLGTPECPAPVCQPAWTLECGGTDYWYNYFYGSTDGIETYNCNDWGYDGPEYTYAFTSPVTGDITVTLSDETAETDILVLSAGENGECLPDSCIAYGYSKVTFDATAGMTYYLVVDGYAGAEGGYTITVECPPDIELDCANGKDDDGDGKKDCDDTDCALASNCTKDCNPPYPFEIGCGFEEDYLNYGWDSTSKVQTYSCTAGTESGPEYAYTFVAEYDATVTVTLSDEEVETDLLVVKADAQGQCFTSNCVKFDYAKVSFDVKKGETYFIIVDGFKEAKGTYHIVVDCKAAKETDCEDGVDNDQDGKIDCLDGDCFPGAGCEPKCVPDTVSMAKITCNSEDSWNNGGNGSTNLIDAYSCNSYLYSGPEYVYTLTVTANKKVTVILSNEADETDVLVLQDGGLGCNPASCIAYGLASVTFDAKKGTTYYVVIDGYWGAEGDYDLEVTCQ